MTYRVNSRSRLCLTLFFLCVLGACAATPQQPPCPAGRQDIRDCPPEGAVQDPVVNSHYEQRTRVDALSLNIDPIKLGMKAEIPTNDALGKIVGSSYQDSIRSLATKIWLVDHASHTVDAAYYIFKRDLVGYAFLGAMCEAVKRGVDLRIMVDSLGSFHSSHSELKALTNCAIDGGFAVNKQGRLTTRKARVQSVIFGAASKPGTNINRRSHDKLLVVDGAFPEKSWVMTGGRNISLAYYGLKPDGSIDPNAYKDMELLLRSPDGVERSESVGQVSEHYVSILLANTQNKVLQTRYAHRSQRTKMRNSLAQLRAMPDFQSAYQDMEHYLQEGLHPIKARLAHELGNITNKSVVSEYDTNLEKNPNSIVYMTRRLTELTPDNHTLRIVSPYLFIPKLERNDGSVYHDGSTVVKEWLNAHPDNRLEIVTNSILTSDNFFTQAIIDMDTAPRLLLDDESLKRWRTSLKNSEMSPDLVESEHWRQLIDNPQVRIYATGRLDADLLGGDTAYGKLHAKFFLTDDWGFVGTTNLDYRSRLFNNEMGFFFLGHTLREELIREFEDLKRQSYLWGSPEWLEMRRQVRELGGMRSSWAKKQHATFTRLRTSGLHWQF